MSTQIFVFTFFTSLPFGHVSRLNTPPAVRLVVAVAAAVCIEMKSFCQPLFIFAMYFPGKQKMFFRRRRC